MNIELKVDEKSILNYSRLSYEPWFAIAELVDNSTQSYLNNKEELDAAYAFEAEQKGRDICLTVNVDYDRDNDEISVWDTAMGMNYEELVHALYISNPPANINGRSRYGMGLKTSACWLGNLWTIETTKLGDSKRYTIQVDLNKIRIGENPVDVHEITEEENHHYTLIKIHRLNRHFRGRTLGKIETHLSSIYRYDIADKLMKLSWRGKQLDGFPYSQDSFLRAEDGSPFYMDVDFPVGDKRIRGWVGILKDGGRSRAGFAILYYNRVIRGQPSNAWHPLAIFGEKRNDLVNQRLVGELHLNDFEVSHTKDDIAWIGTQQEDVEEELKKLCEDYIRAARQHRKKPSHPSPLDTRAALEEIKKELSSTQLLDKLRFESVLSDQEIEDNSNRFITRAATGNENFRTSLQIEPHEVLSIKCFIKLLSENDPYVAIESNKPHEVIVVVNQSHPHWAELNDNTIFYFLKQCIYDALAEWRARRQQSNLQPSTIRTIKDNLLRISFEMEEMAEE